MIKILVPLADIENISHHELDQRRLDTLLHGFSPFEQVLKSGSDPITLDRRFGKPYRIIDGRHRIFLARQRGLPNIIAQFA
ncbi:MAG: hypothetical protein ACR2LT_08625 [Pyrinomonadaceae bacterium]